MSLVNRGGPAPGGILAPHGRPAREVTVAVGYPYGPMRAEFVHSLMRMREHEVALMVKGELPLVRHRLPQGGLYVDQNRNVIAEKFFSSTDADWLLQIDTDIEFPPDLVERLVAIAGSDKRVLAASVPLGPPIPSSALLAVKDKPGNWVYFPSHLITPEGIECDAVASAVLLVHREVFEAIADREGQCWFVKREMALTTTPESAAAWAEGGRVRDRRYVLAGEDVSFCMRVAAAGYKLWCAKVPGLRHYKTVALSHDFEEAEAPAPEATREGCA